MLSKKQFKKLKDLKGWHPFIDSWIFRRPEARVKLSFKEAESLYTIVKSSELKEYIK